MQFFFCARKYYSSEYCQPNVVYYYLASLKTDFHPAREYAQRDYKICVRNERVLKRAGEKKVTKSLISGVEMKAFLSEKNDCFTCGYM